MNKFIKKISIIFSIFLSFIFCCVLFLHIPFVQKELLYYGQTYLKNNVNITSEIEGFSLQFPFNMTFKKINACFDGTKIEAKDITIKPAYKKLVFLDFKINQLDIKELFIETPLKQKTQDKIDIKQTLNTVLLTLSQEIIDEFSIETFKEKKLGFDLNISYQRNHHGHDLIFGTKDQPCAFILNLKNHHNQIDAKIAYHHLSSSPLGLFLDNMIMNYLKSPLRSIDGTFCIHCKESSIFSASIVVDLEDGPITLKGNIEKDQFLINISDASKISYPIFGEIQTLSMQGKYDENCVSISDLTCCTKNQSIFLKGSIKNPLSITDDKSNFNGNFDITLKNNLIIGHIEDDIIKTSINVSYKNGEFNFLQKIPNNLLNPIAKNLLEKEVILSFTKKNDKFFGTLKGINGTDFILDSNDDFSKIIFSIKKINNQSLLDTSKINITQSKEGKVTLSGEIKPIGDNILKSNVTITPLTNELNGKIVINIKDMAPITTFFDFATVGRIKGDLNLKNISFKKKTGTLDIDLHSKYFRSPLFKAALTTIKGTVFGNQKTNLKIEMEELAIGKGFLAEKSSLFIDGENGIFSILLKSKSHKKGYLSSDLDIDIHTILNTVKNTCDFKTFSILHAKQKLSLQNSFNITLSPLFINDAHFILNEEGSIKIKSIKEPSKQIPEWSGSLSATDISLEILSWFFPKSIISGTLDANFELTGTNAIPDFKLNLKGNDIEWLQFHTLSEQNNNKREAAHFDLKAESISHILKWNLNLDGKKIVHIISSGEIPFEKDSLEKLTGDIKGFVDLSLISAIIATGDRLSGPIHFNLNLSGRIEDPIWKGEIHTENAYVELAEFGTVINKITGKIKTDGKHWIIDGITATDEPFINKTKNKTFGDLLLKGKIEFRNLLEPIVNLDLMIKNYQLVDSDSIQGKGSGHLTIQGEGIYSAVKGYADIHTLTVNLDNIETEDTIPTIKLKDPKKRTYAKEYQKEKHTSKKKMILPLDLILKSNDSVSIFGLIITKSLWGGNLSVKGQIDDPYLIGDVHLINGEVDLFGKILKLNKGHVSFLEIDKNSPSLFIQASRKISDVIVILKIDNKQIPNITFDSSPSMAQDEILSWLLFGKSAGNVSVGQSLQLVNALAKLKGINVLSVVDTLKKEIGIDTFDIRDQSTMTTPSSNSTDQQQINQVVHLGKKLTENIELSAEQGTTQGSGKIGIELNVGNNVMISADIASSSKPTTSTNQGTTIDNSGASISWEKRY